MTQFIRFIIKDKFPQGEDIIASDSEESYYYTKDIIKGRFELGEKSISTEVWESYYYTKDIIKGRFELGEDTLRKSQYWNDYLELIQGQDDNI